MISSIEEYFRAVEALLWELDKQARPEMIKKLSKDVEDRHARAEIEYDHLKYGKNL